MKIRARTALIARLAACACVLALCAGCPTTAPLPTEAPVHDMRVRETQSKYLLYVPSYYNENRAWPLVILCHGTKPYDTAWLQIREWAQFAEDKGIIVAAPELQGTRGDFPPKPEKQIALQRADERTILLVVEAIRASHQIADERIFMTGWSGGGYAVLYTGLRHPDIFRALALRQPNFDARFMADTLASLDRWQMVFVYFGTIDPFAEQAQAAVDWLREHGITVQDEAMPGSHRRVPVQVPWRFFERIYKDRPWIRVQAVATDYRRPRRVQFSLKAIPPAQAAHWSFGDGIESDEIFPVHTYEADGIYDVTVTVRLGSRQSFRRTQTVQVPRPAPGTSPPENAP